MKKIVVLVLFCCAYVGYGQTTVTIYNNSCSDKEVHVHWEETGGSCAVGSSCVTYNMEAKVVSAGDNDTFTIGCSTATVYRVQAYTTSGSSSSNRYPTGCGADNSGSEKCGNFQVQGSGAHYEVNP